MDPLSSLSPSAAISCRARLPMPCSMNSRIASWAARPASGVSESGGLFTLSVSGLGVVESARV